MSNFVGTPLNFCSFQIISLIFMNLQICDLHIGPFWYERFVLALI